MSFNILRITNMRKSNIQIIWFTNMNLIMKGGDATNSKLIMKGGDAYKIMYFRQNICSDVLPLGFVESKVGGAR